MTEDDLPPHLLHRINRRQPRHLASLRRVPVEYQRSVLRASQIALAAAALAGMTCFEEAASSQQAPQTSTQAAAR